MLSWRRRKLTKDTTHCAPQWIFRTGTAVAICGLFMTSASMKMALSGTFANFARAGCTQLSATSEHGYKRILRDFESNKTLEIDGPEWDDTLIVGCRITDVEGDGIRIRNVNNLTIKGCTIKNVGGRGIALRSTGGTTNVTIIGNRIENTGSDGISAAQREANGIDHLGLVIGWNFIKDTGKSGRDGRQHSIYSQASDAVIVSNTISSGREGNGISIRSSGLVACNQISGTSRSRKPGIRYFADHASGPSSKLVIRNNSINNSIVGIELIAPPKANERKAYKLVKKFEIYGNKSTSTPVVAIDPFWIDNASVAISLWDNKEIKK